MARTASIILTKEDKKAKLAELNESIKGAKLSLKGVALAFKENDNTLKAAIKEHAGVRKALEKEEALYTKDLGKLEAQKSALVGDTSVAPSAAKSAPDGVVKRTRRTKAEMEVEDIYGRAAA